MIQKLLNDPELNGIIKLETTPLLLEKITTNAIKKALSEFIAENNFSLPDKLIPRKEAMGRINVKTSLTMIRYEKKGYLKPHRIGSRIFYKESEVLDAAERFNREEVA